jgi:SAM-dependent methyltransferase
MLLTAQDLQRVASRTLSHYDEHAQAYWEGTRDHDVSQNVGALLQSIEVPPPFELLDLGCGPGRDLKKFTALGHSATGLEGSAPLAALARANSGCEVLEQNFLALKLRSSHFDGVFANAVLFHNPHPGTTAHPAGTACHVEAGWRAVHLESARRRSGGLEWRPLWRLPRLADLARLRVRCRIRGT